MNANDNKATLAAEPHHITVTRVVDADGLAYCQIPPLFRSATSRCAANRELTFGGERYWGECYERIAWAAADDLSRGWCPFHWAAMLRFDIDDTAEALRQ